MANLERLKAVLDWAEGQEKASGQFTFSMAEWVEIFKEFDGPTSVAPYSEGRWSCNTSACLAGSAALMEGKKIYVGARHANDRSAAFIEENGNLIEIEEWARNYFGLDTVEADTIFYMTGLSVSGMKSFINEYYQVEVFPDVEWTQIRFVPSAVDS